MQELLADPRVTYIMGNHEEMFFKSTREILGGQELTNLSDTYLWFSNGGKPTYKAWLKNPISYSAAQMKYFDIYEDSSHNQIFLSHAGFTPNKINYKNSDDFLWDRNHFYDDWPEQFNSVIIVHGHTPTQYLLNTPNPTVYKYCYGHKIDIDMGTAESKMIVLLDLDTKKVFYFYEGDNNK